MDLSEPLLSAAEAGRLLGVSTSTVRYWRYRGEGPPAYMVGRHLRYAPADVRAWLEGGGRNAVPTCADCGLPVESDDQVDVSTVAFRGEPRCKRCFAKARNPRSA